MRVPPTRHCAYCRRLLQARGAVCPAPSGVSALNVTDPRIWIRISQTCNRQAQHLDIYHIWCNLKPGVSDLEFAGSVQSYLEHLKQDGQLHAYRITRCKLGLRPPQLREFHITLEFDDMTQMQSAFDTVSARADPVESLHHAVNSKIQDIFFALYRDFPDAQRTRGQEKF